MKKHVIVLIIVFVLMYPCLRADDTNFLSTISPNLKQFLIEHPTAMKMFTNALSEAFSNRTVRLYYYYSDDQNERRASHFYPNTAGMPEVIICVPQDSYPLDEFIGVIYETLNSKGEKRFAELLKKARAGTVSRTDFAQGILRVQYDAVISTRDLLEHLGLGKKEIKKSHYYHYYFDMPTDFDGYLSYQKSLFPTNQGPMEEYELKYDSLRKSQP
jgi:hypothetical protein